MLRTMIFSDTISKDDISDLWELFESALNYSQNPSNVNKTNFSKYFNQNINKKGNGNSKITMGLYWLAPNTFFKFR